MRHFTNRSNRSPIDLPIVRMRPSKATNRSNRFFNILGGGGGINI